ncbi:FabD/lysophospholipase-like protein [Viridothelium virens]|uniref:FabD/lysophospholipase-like protein n=1 Tax=Viridothelium virens TaxID=1048519 RepID=A0A6A6HHC4_VIRVR|nr:FabD/lysophospholipase-like protein [Viridothelium virens]
MAQQLTLGGRDSTPAVSIRTPPPEDDDEQSGRTWARQIKDPWEPAILTLDGGGIRGYSSLLILQNLMHEIAEWERRLDKEEEVAKEIHTIPGEGNMANGEAVAAQTPVIATTEYDVGKQQRRVDAEQKELRHLNATPELQHDMETSQALSEQPSRPSIASHDFGREQADEKKRYQDADIPKAVSDREERDASLNPPSFSTTSRATEPLPSSPATLLPDGSTRPGIVEDDLRPCHYFDYMYGTSTGGLIATLLGRLRLTVPQCLEIYREVGNDLFGTKRSVVPFATKYDHRPLEEAVKKIVQRHCVQHENCDGEDWNPWNMEDGWKEGGETGRICQTICLTATHNGKIDEAYLLRTYPHYYPEGTPNWITLYNEGADKLRIWQVTRATSAAPFYFDILEADIRQEMVGFKDGGIRENNPAGAAWSEFISRYGADADPALLLSIGTGRPDERTGDGFASPWSGPLAGSRVLRKAAEKFAVFRNVLIKYTEGEKQHEAMRNQAKGENSWYKRLNVASGMEGMKLDDWRKGKWVDPKTHEERTVPGGASLTRMEEAVKIMMNRDYNPMYDSYAPPSMMIKQAAEKLVRMRRAREQLGKEGDKRWECYVGKTLTEFGKPIERQSEQAFPDPPSPQISRAGTDERLDVRDYLNPLLPRSRSRSPKSSS